MGDLLLGDVEKYGAALRKIISWATQRSTGRVRNFWGLEECRPVWWPSDIPFQCITNPAQSNKKFKKNVGSPYSFAKGKLIKIIKSFIVHFEIHMKKATDNDVVISTMSKSYEETCINNSKRSQDDDSSASNNSFKQVDNNVPDNNCSYFEGILDTPDSWRTNYEHNYSTPFHSTREVLKILIRRVE